MAESSPSWAENQKIIAITAMTMPSETRRRVSLAAVIAVAVLIFSFSAQKGEESGRLSIEVTRWLLSLLMPGFRDFPDAVKLDYLNRFGFIVRKAAHFSEYALLGFTLSVHLHYVIPKRIVPAAWGIATLYAMTDELHQMFVGGRAPAVRDVCIDSAGALTGALVGIGVILLCHKHKRDRLI